MGDSGGNDLGIGKDRELKGPSRDINVKMIFLLFLIHFTGDFYNSFVSALLPAFAEKFSLTLTQVGFIAAISRVLSFVVQPPVGYIADHYRTRLFILGGPLLSTIFIPLTGAAPNFLVLTLFVALGSMGAAMFHPTAAGMVYSFAGSRFALSMSFYHFGGTLAFGLGPVFITYFVTRFGLQSSFYAMILGLTVICFIWKKIPLPAHEGLINFGFIGSLKEVFGGVWKSIVLIWGLGVLRTFVGQSFITFIPVLFSREGYSLVSVGLIVSLYNVAGAISGLFAGWLADRIGYKPVFYLSFCLSAPSLYLLLVVPEGAFVLAFLGGFFVMSTLPLFVVVVQEIAPRGRSMASGLMLGLSYGTGGMMTPITGKLADLYSIRSVLSVLPLLFLLMIPLVYLLPMPGKRLK
jgi:FSR family fosmidomycin resistance protein-like MFS transporter